MDQNKSGAVENGELMAALKVMGGSGRRRQQAQQAPAAPAAGTPAAAKEGGR
jgi:hypothetical protein